MENATDMRRTRPAWRLSVETVVEMRTRYARGEKQADLAREFCCTVSAVSKTVRGKTGPHLGGPITRTRWRREVRVLVIGAYDDFIPES